MVGSPLIRAYRYEIPFRDPFRVGTLSYTHRTGLLLSLEYQGVCAYAEAAPLPAYSRESIDEVIEVFNCNKQTLTEKLVQWPDEMWQKWLEEEQCLPSLAFALDGLRSDLHAKLNHLPLHRYLNPESSDRLGINAVLGLTHPDNTLMLADAAIQAGYRTIKFKVADPTAYLESFVRLKHTYPDLTIRFDANGVWNFNEAVRYVELLAPLQPEYLEQPLGRGQEMAMAKLQAQVSVALAADESLRNLHDCTQLIQLRAAKVWILKPGLIGSFQNLQQMLRLASTHSIRCILTTSLESGIGRRIIAGLITAFADPLQDHGLATGRLLEMDPMPDEHLIRQGYYYPETVAGIGTPAAERLQPLTEL